MRQIFIAICLLCFGVVSLQAGNARIWLEHKIVEGHLRVEAYGQTLLPGRYHYRLSAQRLGGAGSATTSQGGRVILSRDEKTRLARLSLNLGIGERALITLKLYDEHNLLLEQIDQVLPADPLDTDEKG